MAKRYVRHAKRILRRNRPWYTGTEDAHPRITKILYKHGWDFNRGYWKPPKRPTMRLPKKPNAPLTGTIPTTMARRNALLNRARRNV
jgi:hypothetical protein